MGTRKEPEILGEGNYSASRRYRKGAEAFASTHDTQKLAREAAPKSTADAKAMLEAEQMGKARKAKGRTTSPSSKARGAVTKTTSQRR